MTEDQLIAVLSLRSNGRIAAFMPDQWPAIDSVINRRQRLLLVQRTGWGKSLVYFGATIALRAQGAGPTLLISPLIALMRDQQRAAEGLGLRAASMNGENKDEWADVTAALSRNEIDILFLSPEKLANDDFMRERLMPYLGAVRLFVVDEAHCISDWGHDFRPDYQRIRRLLTGLLPANVAVLATTATANDKVVTDVQKQLGDGTMVLRGPLSRDSLHLQAISMPSSAERFAWLADTLPTLPGNGIIYTLTTKAADRLAAWLRSRGLAVEAYHSRLEEEEGAEKGTARRTLEARLRANDLKALVSTTALGMGFDKPDLAFVIHYQAASSIIQYYQQVGRAGRALDSAYGILLCGDDDEQIVNSFIDSAFPPHDHVIQVLSALEEAEDGLKVGELTRAVDLSEGRITHILKLMAVRDQAPIFKDGTKWFRSPHPYEPDHQTMETVSATRRHEWARMKEYVRTPNCRMRFLVNELDDHTAADCGHCASCRGDNLLDMSVNPRTVQDAVRWVRGNGFEILDPKKLWPSCDPFPEYGWAGKIRTPLESGRALSVWGDPGWAKLVKDGKEDGRFDDELVNACAEFISERWRPGPPPTWVTCIPSLRRPELVSDFARRLADKLGLTFSAAVTKIKVTPQQKTMQNSWHQARNLDGAFEVVENAVLEGPVLLVDDIADSAWSLTVCGVLLREAGVEAVHPLVLALAKSASPD
ncbi:MAG: RecQ family ATP-dependent DNA helicase [Rhodospirillaceae bacterium]|nr:RecQ family ATP-dependent DNA helicase [Rhodospirillales bacterium]